MNIKYSDLFEKIEKSDWEYELKWEIFQEGYVSVIKKLKICCILNEPAEVIDNLVSKLEDMHGQLKNVYLWFKTSQEFTNNCLSELNFFKQEINSISEIVSSQYRNKNISKLNCISDFFEQEILEQEMSQKTVKSLFKNK